MKVARLHDGQEMQFPPETDDGAVAAAVRRKMGLPPSEPSMSDVLANEQVLALRSAVDAFQQLLQQFGAVLSRIDQSTQAAIDSGRSTAGLVREVGSMLLKVDSSVKAMSDIGKSVDKLATATDASQSKVVAAIGKAVNDIESVLTAPKEVQYDVSGKLSGLTTIKR